MNDDITVSDDTPERDKIEVWRRTASLDELRDFDAAFRAGLDQKQAEAEDAKAEAEAARAEYEQLRAEGEGS